MGRFEFFKRRFAAAHGGAHPRTQADLCVFIRKNPLYNEKKETVKKKKVKK